MSQNTLFFDEKKAIEELQERGYRITKEEYPAGRCVSNTKDLVEFFYACRRFYNPDRKFPESIDYSEDRNYLTSFIKSRQKLGLSKSTAIKEVAQIIDALFKYEDLLNLKEPIRSAAILSVRPIMDRICSFMNGEVAEASELDNELVVREWNCYYDKHFAERDRKMAAEQRKIILEKMHEQERK